MLAATADLNLGQAGDGVGLRQLHRRPAEQEHGAPGAGARQAHRQAAGHAGADERRDGSHGASGGCAVGLLEVDRRATAA